MSSLPAGDFSDWLRAMRKALAGEGGMDVACGDCVGCCTSSYYIKVRSKESRALAAIDPRHLDPEPTAAGDRIMGFDSNGHCHLFANGGCSIYADRPDTCRTYDCRVFAAVGMPAGGDDKAVINERVARWRFDYPSESDRREQGAVRAAADYLRQHPVRFPNGRVPSRPSDIAVLAVKTYRVFLDPPANDPEIVRAIIEANREFARS
jgi:Fe-S-cluster containining protein